MKFLVFASVLFLTVSVYGDWVAGPWKECSAVCDGVQVRKVYCKNPVTGDVAPDSLCDAKPKPATSQPCSPPCTYEWVAGEWGECSEMCGPGFQSRSVTCTKVETSEVVSESYCDSPSMPALTQPCDLGVCTDEDIIDEDIVDEDIIDEDAADENVADEDPVDEDLFEGEADEDIIDIDEIFIDEDTTDDGTVIDEIAVNDDQTGDEDQSSDESQTADNSNSDEDSAYGNDLETDTDDISVVDTAGSNDSGCGCNVIGL
ncbi:MAG TPA: hypothetical protein P5044_01675 [bacterium]|nr:hypothetical protein [bacterium]